MWDHTTARVQHLPRPHFQSLGLDLENNHNCALVQRCGWPHTTPSSCLVGVKHAGGSACPKLCTHQRECPDSLPCMVSTKGATLRISASMEPEASPSSRTPVAPTPTRALGLGSCMLPSHASPIMLPTTTPSPPFLPSCFSGMEAGPSQQGPRPLFGEAMVTSPRGVLSKSLSSRAPPWGTPCGWCPCWCSGRQWCKTLSLEWVSGGPALPV